MRTHVYIDGNNLYRAAKELGFKIDYKKFRGWLRQKYASDSVFLFIGEMPDKIAFYQYLEESGFILVFKQTLSVGGVVKGNCDAELVLSCVSDFYTKKFSQCYLVTGDGDFGCLVEFLKDRSAIAGILSPDKKKCSFLLKNKGVQISFLNEHYHKFSSKIAPMK